MEEFDVSKCLVVRQYDTRTRTIHSVCRHFSHFFPNTRDVEKLARKNLCNHGEAQGNMQTLCIQRPYSVEYVSLSKKISLDNLSLLCSLLYTVLLPRANKCKSVLCSF